MSGHCHAIGCHKALAVKFLMCATHWRLVPPIVKKLWRWACADHELTKGNPGSNEAWYENYEEVRRIVDCIERGVPA